MGIIPLFNLGETNALFLWKFTLIKKAKSRIKVFEPFEVSPKKSSMIDAILILLWLFFKRSSKPVMKGSRVESIKEARNEYKKW